MIGILIAAILIIAGCTPSLPPDCRQLADLRDRLDDLSVRINAQEKGMSSALPEQRSYWESDLKQSRAEYSALRTQYNKLQKEWQCTGVPESYMPLSEAR